MIYQFLALLFTHWIADFVCQSHWMASNKSKDNYALIIHVSVYSLVLYIATFIIFGARYEYEIIKFVALNFILHFITDYITSRITSRLWAKQDIHNFFVVIGLDQLIHQLTLAFTMIWIFK